MPVLISMCGAPFSGKTTLAKRIASATGSRYLSLDDLMRARGLDLSQSQPVEEWERTHQACFRLIAAALQVGESVVIDDTNYMRWLRDRFRTIAILHNCTVVTVYLNVPLAELERRRQGVLITGERNTLADDAFYTVVNSMEIPGKDENTCVFHATDDIDASVSLHVSSGEL